MQLQDVASNWPTKLPSINQTSIGQEKICLQDDLY
jgi:hypothetical protein